jgi:hypothetical protein
MNNYKPFDIWDLTLGFECCVAAPAIMQPSPFEFMAKAEKKGCHM